ncbi:hypothetical protein BLNAU_2831 [Blattamonas nauphoetae]|uniref:Uncharacterized protein n=1 Tax=Blattamonas nauphoetae TaxID=2049346 RepID=A0ABQ9YEI4_9EUKA|nr:hypothetical protein BLNAU_2831 [Blattamonas nauphoetae]
MSLTQLLPTHFPKGRPRLTHATSAEDKEHRYLSHPPTKLFADEQAKGYNVERDKSVRTTNSLSVSLPSLHHEPQLPQREGSCVLPRVRFFSSLLPDDQPLLHMFGLPQIDLSQNWLTLC